MEGRTSARTSARAESLGEGLRAHGQMLVKAAAQVLGMAEAAQSRNGRNGRSLLPEQRRRRFDTHALHILGGASCPAPCGTRAPVRGGRQACSASRSTLRSEPIWPGIQSSSVASRGACVVSAASRAELRLPTGLVHEHHQPRCATASAVARPRSASTKASARSMPAVTPADVNRWL